MGELGLDFRVRFGCTVLELERERELGFGLHCHTQ